MMDHIGGVAKRLQERAPAAIAVHCFAHSVNLVLQVVAKQCRPVKDALDLIRYLVKLFRTSPKRSLLFGKCAADLSLSLNDDVDNESDNYPPETASTANVSPSATASASPVHKQSTHNN